MRLSLILYGESSEGRTPRDGSAAACVSGVPLEERQSDAARGSGGLLPVRTVRAPVGRAEARALQISGLA
jgi:hypothetical protein